MWEDFTPETVFKLIEPIMCGGPEYFETPVLITVWGCVDNGVLPLACEKRTCVIYAKPHGNGKDIFVNVRGLDVKVEAKADTVLTKLTATLPGKDIEVPGWPTENFNKWNLPFVMRPGDTWRMVLDK